MVQDILTYITILAALGIALFRLVRFFIRTARGENPGCSSCSLHNLHLPDKEPGISQEVKPKTIYLNKLG